MAIQICVITVFLLKIPVSIFGFEVSSGFSYICISNDSRTYGNIKIPSRHNSSQGLSGAC